MPSWAESAVDRVRFEECADYDGIGGMMSEGAFDAAAYDGIGGIMSEGAFDAAAYYNEDLLQVPDENPVEPSTRNEVVLEEHGGNTLPDVILDMILMRLSLAAQYRFRCVCRDRKRALPSLWCSKQTIPVYSILTSVRPGTARFFCHDEKKWLSLPFTACASREVNLDWELLDVDAGCFCYSCTLEGRSGLSVCNPLINFERVIAENFEFSRDDRLKLLVDRQSKTFKMVVPNERLAFTSGYDLTTASWRVCSSYPSVWSGRKELFVWKNVLSAYKSKQGFSWDKFVMSFNVETGQWTFVDAKYPDEISLLDQFWFLSSVPFATITNLQVGVQRAPQVANS